MRATLGTAVAAAALVMMAMALWPDTKQPLPLALAGSAAAIAQEAAPPEIAEAPAAVPAGAPRGEPLDPLARRLDAEFIETPLSEVLDFLSHTVDGQIYVNRRRLAAAEIPLDAPLTLRLKKVRADMLLELALRQVSDNLAYVVRDGIVIVSTVDDLEDAAELRVYNVRDFLTPASPEAVRGDMMEMMMSMAPPAGAPPGMGGGDSYGAGMMPGGSAPSREERSFTFVQMVRTTIGQQHWQEGGGFGAIAAYDGLLVVNHNTRVHQQVERLLEMLRAAARQPQPADEQIGDATPNTGG
jgi:hypothetical protein